MFTKATFKFLDELAANNNRAWFEENKPRYEALVREPRWILSKRWSNRSRLSPPASVPSRARWAAH